MRNELIEYLKQENKELRQEIIKLREQIAVMKEQESHKSYEAPWWKFYPIYNTGTPSIDPSKVTCEDVYFN